MASVTKQPGPTRLSRQEEAEAAETRATASMAIDQHLRRAEDNITQALALMPDNPDFFAIDLALYQLADELSGTRVALATVPA